MVERYRAGRDLVRAAAGRHARGWSMSRPEAAFYVMFGVQGMTDSLEFAKKLVHEAKVGLAPGSAFGPGGEGHLRLCFAASTRPPVEGDGPAGAVPELVASVVVLPVPRLGPTEAT